MDYLFDLLQDSGIGEILQQRDIQILLGVAIFFWLFTKLNGRNKSERTNAMLANRKVKYILSKKGVSQLKKFDIEKLTLYCGSFKNWQVKPIFLWLYTYILGHPPSIFVPTANPGIKVLGIPGMGKTFSVINPLLISAIDQEFPIVLYDYKASKEEENDKEKKEKKSLPGGDGQMSFIGGYAARHGYKIRIFAPGKDYSCTINPLDFIINGEDFAMAETLAKTFHANIQGSNKKSDDFFGPSGIKVLQASFLTAKNTQYPDLAMAYAILHLPKLKDRLVYAKERGAEHYTVWNQVGFGQYISAAESDETGAGILAQAELTVGTFIQPDILGCFIGKTNVSLKLGSKELIIFQSDEERKRAINPAISGIIEVLVNKNFSYQRNVPLILSFDEFTSLKIEESTDWPNRHRSKGLIMIVGYQSDPQLVGVYGKEKADSLQSPLNTTFLFNPNNEQTAKRWSADIGKKEIIIKNRSTSYGKGNGKQTTISEQRILTEIKNPDDINSMPRYAAIYKNADAELNGRASIPWDMPKVRVTGKDKRIAKSSEKIWRQEVAPAIAAGEAKRRVDRDTGVELMKRFKLAEHLYPLPPKEIDAFSL
jgi:type IV secretion system protein VirD4